MKEYYVYILASTRNGTLYVGVTGSLKRRVWEHKSGVEESFTKKYGVDKLVHFEKFNSIEYAIKREKQIKGWKREWKLELIEKANPGWVDLFDEVSC